MITPILVSISTLRYLVERLGNYKATYRLFYYEAPYNIYVPSGFINRRPAKLGKSFKSTK